MGTHLPHSSVHKGVFPLSVALSPQQDPSSQHRPSSPGVWGSVQLTTVYRDTPQGSAPGLALSPFWARISAGKWAELPGTAARARGGLSCTPGMRGSQSCSRCSGVKREALMLCRLKETTPGSFSCPIPAVPSSPHKCQGQPTARRQHRNNFIVRNHPPPTPAVPNPCGISFFSHWAGLGWIRVLAKNSGCSEGVGGTSV